MNFKTSLCIFFLTVFLLIGALAYSPFYLIISIFELIAKFTAKKLAHWSFKIRTMRWAKTVFTIAFLCLFISGCCLDSSTASTKPDYYDSTNGVACYTFAGRPSCVKIK